MIIPVLMMAYSVYTLMVQLITADHQPDLLISLDQFSGVRVAVSSDNQIISNILKALITSGSATYEPVPTGTELDNYMESLIENNLVQYKQQMIAGFKYNSSHFLGEFSWYFIHSPPLVLNLISNILLQQKNALSSITVSNHPITVEIEEDLCDLSLEAEELVIYIPPFVAFSSLGLLVLMISFINSPLKERVTRAKQLQLMTGVSPLLYWLSHFLLDIAMYLITVMLMIVAVYLFQKHNIYSASGDICTLVLVLVLFGLSGIGYAYFFSFLVESSAKAAVYFVFINLLTGVFASAMFTLTSHLYSTYDVITFFLSFNPIFAAASALIYLFTLMYINGTCLQCGKDCQTQDAFQFLESGLGAKHPNGILNFLIFLIVDTVLYFGLVFLIEYGIINNIWFLLAMNWNKMDTKLDVDADVLIEKQKVVSIQNVPGYVPNGTVLLVNDLGKKYSKTTAVYGVSFQVGKGECFGLLGVNGAGKSTTFKMLTGEVVPNKGDARILQFSIKKEQSKFLSQIGYCPQSDAINKLLTGKEMLRVYALLRGIPSSLCDSEVSRWIDIMGLKEYADRLCGTYSGGNKRKLSTAIAFMGEPSVVLLDEPTSGVDPVSRRKLWDVVSECQQAGQVIVLTSHSMEECEALCSRLTIMVAGQMKCIGSTEYLKYKFGQGFTVKIKLYALHQQAHAVEAVKQDMISQFRYCSIKDENSCLLHYHVPDPTIRLAVLFAKLEHLKGRHSIIEDYNISDTTLEEVFIHFARGEKTKQLL